MILFDGVRIPVGKGFAKKERRRLTWLDISTLGLLFKHAELLMYPLLQCHDLLNFYCFYVHAFSFVTTFRILFIPCISYLVLSKYISIRTYIFFSGELFCKCKKDKEVLSVPIKPCVPVDYRFPVKHFAHSCTF